MYLFLLTAFLCLTLAGGCVPVTNIQGASQPEEFPAEDTDSFLILETLPESALVQCPAQEIEFITNQQVYQTPTLSEPAPRIPFRDLSFGTCLVRVTERQQDPLNPSDDSLGLKNEYARVQSFNADDSLILVRSLEAFWYVYDANALVPLGEVPAVVEPRWDAKNPLLLYYLDEYRLLAYDLRTGDIGEVHNFADDFPDEDLAAVWTRYEGSPSFDSRYWGLLAQNADWEALALLVYDRLTDDIVIRELPPGYSIDNVTISPLGNYLLASFDEFCDYGNLGSMENPCGLMVYDNHLDNAKSLLRIIGHYDTALDAAGREVIVYQDIDTDHISMLDLESGKVTPLLEIDFSHTALGFHFSGRAVQVPGWALVSTYNGGYPQDATWMDDVVFALELKAGGRVVRLAHTHSLYNEEVEQDYWAEPHATVNQNFTRVLFTTNWGRSGTDEVDMMMIILPDNWIETLP